MKKHDQNPAPRTDNRFDLRALGLSDRQLREVSGARPADKTGTVTVAGVTKCCW